MKLNFLVESSGHGVVIRVGRGLLVGVDHGRELVINDGGVVAALVKAARDGGVYYEGSEPEGVVASFIKRVLKVEPFGSWEPPVSRESAPLVLDLFGGSVVDLYNQVSSHSSFNESGSIIDNLVSTSDVWSVGGRVNRVEVEALLRKAGGRVSSDLFRLVRGGMNYFSVFHQVGFNSAFPKDGGSSVFEAEVSRANVIRARALYRRVVGGGVAFAGSSHLEAVQRLHGERSK